MKRVAAEVSVRHIYCDVTTVCAGSPKALKMALLFVLLQIFEIINHSLINELDSDSIQHWHLYWWHWYSWFMLQQSWGIITVIVAPAQKSNLVPSVQLEVEKHFTF